MLALIQIKANKKSNKSLSSNAKYSLITKGSSCEISLTQTVMLVLYQGRSFADDISLTQTVIMLGAGDVTECR